MSHSSKCGLNPCSRSRRSKYSGRKAVGAGFIVALIILSLFSAKTFAVQNASFNPSRFIFAPYNPFDIKKETKSIFNNAIFEKNSNMPKFSYGSVIAPTHIPRQVLPTVTPTVTTAPPVVSVAPTSVVVTSIPIPTSAQLIPIQTQAPSSTNSVLDFIMNAVNDYRRSNGLGNVSTNSYTCNFANTRAQEVSSNFSHDGFTNRINSKTLPYPSYSLVVENLAMTSDYKNVVNLWINSSGHAANLRADTPYACVGNSGNYYAYEGWKP